MLHEKHLQATAITLAIGLVATLAWAAWKLAEFTGLV
jgi:hypothetical protein